jgi:hypothetical protein
MFEAVITRWGGKDWYTVDRVPVESIRDAYQRFKDAYDRDTTIEVEDEGGQVVAEFHGQRHGATS